MFRVGVERNARQCPMQNDEKPKSSARLSYYIITVILKSCLTLQRSLKAVLDVGLLVKISNGQKNPPFELSQGSVRNTHVRRGRGAHVIVCTAAAHGTREITKRDARKYGLGRGRTVRDDKQHNVT